MKTPSANIIPCQASKLAARTSLLSACNLRALSVSAILAAISTFPAHAILDTNNNGLSDLWEKQHNNGNLFPNTFLATHDKDQDGWTNAKEAIAGTDPFNPNPPDGIVAVEITPSLVPGAFTLTWPTLIGKNYQLQVSTDLVTWTNLGYPITTTQNTHTIGLNTTQPDNTIPANVFWQVAVTDLDSDLDGLTDAEEYNLNTDPESSNSLAGIPDLWLAKHFSITLQINGIAGINLNADSDGDGNNNLEEYLNGTDPNETDAPTNQQWIVVRGDGPQLEARTRTKQITIPAGQTVLLTLAIASEEYVNGYTVPDEIEEFDDILTWNIQPTGQQSIEGEVNVNSRHEEWIIADSNQQILEGLPGPIHHEVTKILTAPATSDLTVNVQISGTNVADDILPSYVAVGLVALDFDLIHPATGELAESEEETGTNGFVSIKRIDYLIDAAPVTKIVIRGIKGADENWKVRIKYNSGGRYKLYKDSLRNFEAPSEITEFDLLNDHFLYFQGLQKSTVNGGEEITLEYFYDDSWVAVDLIKFSVVQSEFVIQVKAFIPYAWTEGEDEIPGPNGFSPLLYKVAKGDLHSLTTLIDPTTGLPIIRFNGRPVSPGFVNNYSTSREPPSFPGDPMTDIFDHAPFRVCQTVILTPYPELHNGPDLYYSRETETAPMSELYSKGTSVHPSEFHLKMGYLDLIGSRTDFGKPPITADDFRQESRTGKITEIHIEAAGKDGAMGIFTPFTDDVHWDLWLKIDAATNPLQPTIQFGGVHDAYPAYEIIVINSSGTFQDVHRVSPASGARPGPYSLGPAQQINVGRTDVIE